MGRGEAGRIRELIFFLCGRWLTMTWWEERNREKQIQRDGERTKKDTVFSQGHSDPGSSQIFATTFSLLSLSLTHICCVFVTRRELPTNLQLTLKQVIPLKCYNLRDRDQHLDPNVLTLKQLFGAAGTGLTSSFSRYTESIPLSVEQLWNDNSGGRAVPTSINAANVSLDESVLLHPYCVGACVLL